MFVGREVHGLSQRILMEAIDEEAATQTRWICGGGAVWRPLDVTVVEVAAYEKTVMSTGKHRLTSRMQEGGDGGVG